MGSAQGIEKDADEGTSSGKGYGAGVWPRGSPWTGAEVARPGQERDPDKAGPVASAAHMASAAQSEAAWDSLSPRLRRLPPTRHRAHTALLTC